MIDSTENATVEEDSTASAVATSTVQTVVILVLVVGVALYFGLWLRHDQWDRTTAIRFEDDVAHGYGWGQIGRQVGVFNVYDFCAAGRLRQIPTPLDYNPLRLVIVTTWASWAHNKFPSTTEWKNDYELTSFMLDINTAAELVSSILVFLLVRYWIFRDTVASSINPKRFHGIARSTIAGMLFWFNPAVIWDGHCFPQWDSWNMPFFLGATLLACLDWWFAAGCCLVIGAFLKGQILLVAPIFLIWPLIQLQFGRILRCISGFVLAGAMLALPWLHASSAALIWYFQMLGAMALLAPLVLGQRLKPIWRTALPVSACLLAWPWKAAAEPSLSALLPALVLAAVALSRFMSPRIVPYVFTLAVGVNVLLTIPLFGASSTWFTQGFEFGTVKSLHMGRTGTNNLPTVLVSYFHWSNDPLFDVSLPLLGASISFRMCMWLIYVACLATCATASAIHIRRNDPRFLLAMVTPWLLWFLLLPQMNNRYLVWASGLSALFVAVDLGTTLLGLLVSAFGWIGVAQVMYASTSGGNSTVKKLLDPLCPHLVWALLLIGVLWMYVVIWPLPLRDRSRANF